MDYIDIAIIGKFLPDDQVKLVNKERLFVYNDLSYEIFMDIDQIQFQRGNFFLLLNFIILHQTRDSNNQFT